jgi:electron transfer flavoprotein alpha/beta subunit
MRVCIVLAEPRLGLAERPGRPSQLALNERMRVEDALLGLGRDAARDANATVVAIVVGGRMMRGVARHALTAGVAESIWVPVADLGAWPDADAARLLGAAVRHVGADVAVVGAEGADGLERLAGQIAVHAQMALCTSMLALHGGEALVAEHELEHERVRLQHATPLVSTAARSLLATAPCFGYNDVAASAGREVTTLDPEALGILAPDSRSGRIAFTRLEGAQRRREVVAGAEGVDAALHFLELIGAVQ